MISKNIKSILNEINFVLSKVKESEVVLLEQKIISSNKIVVCGAGRVGMAARGFGMRLAHLGINSYTLGDSNVPSIGENDMLLVCSGSGETKSILEIVKIAKNNNATVVLITGNNKSSMGIIAEHVVNIKAPSKVKKISNFTSIQPMTTLNEQCLGIFFDAVVLDLMKLLKETNSSMLNRHSNLE